MPIPSNAKPGDFFLVSFDGKNPKFSNVDHWLKNGGAIRVAQMLNGEGFHEYEHAAIYIGNSRIVEAQNTGVDYANVHKYDNNETYWSSGIINPTDAQRALICEAAEGYVGTPYSWPDYAAMVAHSLHLLPATKMLKDYVASSKHMICSQTVDQCYEDAGYHLFDDKRWPGYVTPGSLNNLLDSIKERLDSIKARRH